MILARGARDRPGGVPAAARLTLVAVGVLAGIAAGVALGTFALSRRTTSAPIRLADANQLDDARVSLFGGAGAEKRIAAVPGVTSAWTAQTTPSARSRARAGSSSSISFGPSRPPDLFTPVVASGRAASDDAVDEVIVTEALAERRD